MLSAPLHVECMDIFNMFDKDGDGHITYDELCDVMRLLGNNPTEEDLKGIMEELDTNSESGIRRIPTTPM